MNLQKMMKQAQQMQAKMAEMQTEMEKKEYIGEAGGGLVKVTLNGKGFARGVDIDPSLLAEDEKDVLEDLLVAAINDAKQKGEGAAASEMSSLTEGLPIPPGMKLPF